MKMRNDEFETLLAATLRRRAGNQGNDEAAVDRVLRRLAGPLPRQRTPFWRLPAALLDWQFAPAWPRMAALAACLVLGFGIGISGLDRGLASTEISAGNADYSALVFEPESLTGGRP
jgi:hypothetical protein